MTDQMAKQERQNQLEDDLVKPQLSDCHFRLSLSDEYNHVDCMRFSEVLGHCTFRHILRYPIVVRST